MAASLCHSLVRHTNFQLLSKRILSESEISELENEQNFVTTEFEATLFILYTTNKIR